MGRLLLTWRLVASDLRRRPGEAAMFVVAVTACTAFLTLGLTANNAVVAGYMKTRAATAGPDITAITPSTDPVPMVEAIDRAPGVAARTGPIFAFDTEVRANGRTASTSVEGRDAAPSAVDRPLVTSGTWVRPGGAVVERGFAQALGVDAGDRVTIGGRAYPVVGTAISAATPVHPWSNWAQIGPSDRGGRIWFTTADARAAADDESGVHLVHVKLTESDADSVARWGDEVFTSDGRGVVGTNIRDWQTVLHDDMNMIHGTQPSLVVGGWLLAVAATVTLAALAAVRAVRDNRRAGLLKAVGAGPGTVAAVLLAQYLLLTALATALGLAVGSLAAPELADPSAGLLNTAGPPSTAIVVAAAVLAVLVAVAGTLGPVLRAARTSTVAALAAPAHPHAHHPWLTAMTAYLPTSLLVGVRLLVRRPGRAVLTFVGMTATAVTVTAMLGYRTAVATDPGTGLTAAAMEAVNDRNAQVILGITLALAALSAVNTVFLGWSAAVQARRSLAITRTLGATPGQVVAAICTAQLLPVVPALLLGAPSGSVLLWLVGGRLVTPPGSWLLAAAAVILLGAAALTALPAWLQTRGPAGRALEAGPA